jgi:hypothetical protein
MSVLNEYVFCDQVFSQSISYGVNIILITLLFKLDAKKTDAPYFSYTCHNFQKF